MGLLDEIDARRRTDLRGIAWIKQKRDEYAYAAAIARRDGDQSHGLRMDEMATAFAGCLAVLGAEGEGEDDERRREIAAAVRVLPPER